MQVSNGPPKMEPLELIFHVEAEIYGLLEIIFLRYKDRLWNIWTPKRPSTVEEYEPQERWRRTLNKFINHKNKHTAHTWTVLVSSFLWATNKWLEPHRPVCNIIKPGCSSVQPACRLSAFSKVCLIQNDGLQTASLVDGFFFKASVSSILSTSWWIFPCYQEEQVQRVQDQSLL